MTNTKTITAENLEPWNGNIVDLTMHDGSHRLGLLQRIDTEWVRLKSFGSTKVAPDDGLVRIADARSIARGARN
jgi:hypothetical protein